MLIQNLYRAGSRSDFFFLQRADPDPITNRPGSATLTVKYETAHLKIVEVEPGIQPGGGDGQLEGQRIAANVDAHQCHDGDVNVHLGPWWLSLGSVVSFNTLYHFFNCYTVCGQKHLIFSQSWRLPCSKNTVHHQITHFQMA
jgi:hypothetical protein